MKTNILFYNSGAEKAHFELQSGIRPWGIVMLITEGRYVLELPKAKQVYTLSANTISYIPPNTYFIRKIEEPIHFHQFHVRWESDDFLTCGMHSGILQIPKKQVSAIGRSLQHLKTTSPQPEILQHILEHIVTENYIFSVAHSPYSTCSDDISRVLCYMEEHLTEEFKLITMSKIANLSPTGLIWKFRRQLQTTPQQHFIHLRMQQAKQLLVETSLSITQIAEKCGYSDLYCFSNAFRKNVGVSPSTFRNSPRI